MAWLRQHSTILIVAIIKFSLPFLLQNSIYEPHRDEFLYLEQGHHLAWGYMEVPPLLSIFAWLTHLVGGGFFWLKFWPCLFGALNVFVIGKMVMELGGKRFAQFVAGICLITGGYLRVHFLFQPGFLEYFFWSLGAYMLVCFINRSTNRYLYLLALTMVFSFYSKYSVAFFIAGILVALLLTKHRFVFKNKHLYFAAAMALVLITPNLVWQYMHKWPVVHHMQELRETQLQYVSPVDFLKNQLLMNLPCFFVWIGGLFWLFFSKEGERYRVLGWLYIVVVFLLAVTHGKDYYTLGTYPMLFAVGGVWLERATVRLHWLRYVAFAVILLLWLPIIPIALPVWEPQRLAAYYRTIKLNRSGALNWEDLKEHPLPQDFADMMSWKEMGDKVSAAYASLPDAEKSNTMIYCRNYAQAGAITYFGKGLPQVHTDNASFLLWMPDRYNIKNLLFVGRNSPPVGDVVFEQFESYHVTDSITNALAREFRVKIILFKNGNDSVNALIEKSIKEKKDEYRR